MRHWPKFGGGARAGNPSAACDHERRESLTGETWIGRALNGHMRRECVTVGHLLMGIVLGSPAWRVRQERVNCAMGCWRREN